MLAIVLFAVCAVAILAPETPLGRPIRELLIDAPARKLSFRRAHFVALVFAVGALLALNVFMKTDGVMLFAQGFPEAVSWFVTFDIATCIDAIALLAFLAAHVSLRAACLALRSANLLVRRWVLTVLHRLRLRQACRASSADSSRRREGGRRALAVPGRLLRLIERRRVAGTLCRTSASGTGVNGRTRPIALNKSRGFISGPFSANRFRKSSQHRENHPAIA